MTIFRPCIDLHNGAVKQIVGGTLSSSSSTSTTTTTASSSTTTLRTNFISPHSAAHYAEIYREHGLRGAHVIMLGPGNEDAVVEALKVWPGGLQVGGGIKGGEEGRRWVERGAGKVRE